MEPPRPLLSALGAAHGQVDPAVAVEIKILAEPIGYHRQIQPFRVMTVACSAIGCKRHLAAHEIPDGARNSIAGMSPSLNRSSHVGFGEPNKGVAHPLPGSWHLVPWRATGYLRAA